GRGAHRVVLGARRPGFSGGARPARRGGRAGRAGGHRAHRAGAASRGAVAAGGAGAPEDPAGLAHPAPRHAGRRLRESDRPHPAGRLMLERSALWQLTHARMMGFLREPEALFWVFAFPLLLALALGIAFRNSGPQKSNVGVVMGPGADPVVAAL